MYHIFFIRLSVDGHLSCFHFLAIMNSATVNIGVDVPFPGGSEVKNLPASAGDAGLLPGLGRLPEGNGNPLQYSCLKNPMDRGAWRAAVHGLAKSWT